MENYKSFAHLNTELISNLMKCMAICKACMHKCVEEGQEEAAVLCAECADVCGLALKFKCAESGFSHDVLTLCAQVCKKCADKCHKISAQHCKECSDMCKRCCASCVPQCLCN